VYQRVEERMSKKYIRKSNEEKRQEIEKITNDLDEEISKIFESEAYNLLEKTSVRDKLRVAESKSDEMKQIKVKSHEKNNNLALSIG
jgi:hypothetical protein